MSQFNLGTSTGNHDPSKFDSSPAARRRAQSNKKAGCDTVLLPEGSIVVQGIACDRNTRHGIGILQFRIDNRHAYRAAYCPEPIEPFLHSQQLDCSMIYRFRSMLFVLTRPTIVISCHPRGASVRRILLMDCLRAHCGDTQKTHSYRVLQSPRTLLQRLNRAEQINPAVVSGSFRNALLNVLSSSVVTAPSRRPGKGRR